MEGTDQRREGGVGRCDCFFDLAAPRHTLLAPRRVPTRSTAERKKERKKERERDERHPPNRVKFATTFFFSPPSAVPCAPVPALFRRRRGITAAAAAAATATPTPMRAPGPPLAAGTIPAAAAPRPPSRPTAAGTHPPPRRRPRRGDAWCDRRRRRFARRHVNDRKWRGTWVEVRHGRRWRRPPASTTPPAGRRH